MKTSNDANFGESILSLVSLLESAVTGNLLNNQPVDGLLYKYHSNLIKAIITYLDNSEPSNKVGTNAMIDLNKFVACKQKIFDRELALEPTGEFNPIKE